MHTILQIISRIIAGFLMIVCIGGVILLAWVATGPRSLNSVTPYIERAFNAESSSYTITIKETMLLWDSWQHPIDIRLHDVRVKTKAGQTFSRFPEISLGLDFLMLPLGQVLPTSITLSQPVIHLFQNEDRSISFGFAHPTLLGEISEKKEEEEPEPTGTAPFAALLEPLIAPESSGNLRKLQRISIRDAKVIIGNGQKEYFTLTDVDVQARRGGNVVVLMASADMHYGDHTSAVNGQFSLAKGANIEGNIDFKELAPGALASFFADNAVFRAINVPLSGKIELFIDGDGIVQKTKFVLDGGSGSIDSDKLAASIPLNTLHIEGQANGNGQDIEIKAFTANTGVTLITGDGIMSLKGSSLDSAHLNLALKNAKATDVKLFWPPTLSPMSREWIVENITHGQIEQAELHVNLQSGDIDKPILPKESIDATVDIGKATIRYLPEHPPVTNVRGTIKIDGVSLNADIAGGEFRETTKLSNGKLRIDDLNADNPYINIRMDAETTAKEAINFLKLPYLPKPHRLNLDAEHAEGTATVHAALGFNFYAPRDAKGRVLDMDVAYDIDGELRDFGQPALLNKFDMKGITGTLSIDEKGIEFTGKGQVNGADASDSHVIYTFKPVNGYDTIIDVTATAPMESLPRFGYPAMSYAKGSLGVKAKVKVGDTQELTTATIDLTDTALDVKEFGWVKSAKDPATLELTAQKEKESLGIPSVTLRGKDVDVSGAIILNKDFTGVQRASMEKFIVGKNNLSHVDYEHIEGGWRINARGQSADITWLLADDGTEPTFSFEHFPALQLKGDVKRLILGPGREFANVKGDVNCDLKMCNSANVNGETSGGKPFNFRILRNPKGQRQLSMNADDAGEFLRTTNVFTGMEGGTLTVTSNYETNDKGNVQNGRLLIDENTLKKAPVLAKILAVASFTGVVDTLQGNGIRFNKISIPYSLQNDVISIKKGRAHGPSIGLTAEGTITFPKRNFNINGTVVPAYALNSMVGKVPVIGKIITGGEGQGLLAASYTITGPESDLKTDVNPLSILTPGFLRGIFDIGSDENSN